MTGSGAPRRSSSSTIRGTAAAASSLLTVTRTSSLPASASAAAWATVAMTSAVSVLVIAWTTMGCRLPTGTDPIRTVGVGRRRMPDMERILTASTVNGGQWSVCRCVGCRAIRVYRLPTHRQPTDALCQSQRPGQSLPRPRVEGAVLLERGECREDLGSIAVDVAIAQLADHPGEAVLVFVGIELTALAALGELPELRGDTTRGDGL